jgi:hypothetical protein
MPHDHRDRDFENALARNLQSNPQAGPGPAAPINAPLPASASNSVAAPHCLDAETLAACHDRLLAPEEMILARQHIDACERCQEILAQLQATDEIPLEADREALQPQSVNAVPQMQRVHAGLASEYPGVPVALTKATSPMQTPRRAANWRWLVPIGALAAAVMVWVAVHESGSTDFQLAKNQSQPAPPLSPAPSAAAKQESSTNSQLPPTAQNSPAANAGTSTRDDEAPRQSKVRPSASAGKSATPPANLRLGDSLAFAKRAQLQAHAMPQSPPRQKQFAPGALPSSAEETPAPLDADAARDRLTVAPSAPQQLSRVAAARAAGAPAPQKPQAAVDGTLAFRDTANLETKPIVVSSPDGAATWRLGPSGLLQFSDDSGDHWTLQKTGIVASLLAGSAPSSEVCWLAGRNGAILRTIDAGAHWQKLPSPTSLDITAVFSINAQQAVITTSTNQSFKTIDSGNTWTPQP